MDNVKASLSNIVGGENLLDSPEILLGYAKDQSFAKEMKPWCVVKPKDADQVEALVKWANKARIPLVPVSSQGPHTRGDTVPGAPEAVIVDVSNMKKIHSINRQHRMAVIEPGVTYGELQAALAEKGLALSTSLAPRAGKSVLTSVLEVEPRINAVHQWSYSDPLRCMEVVWGDGVRMYTGEAGGGVRDLEKQWEKERWQVASTGPMMFDFYRMLTSAQGTMGVVTWASVKLEVLPQIHRMYFVPAQQLSELEDFVRRVVRLRFSDELFVLNGAALAGLMGETPEQIAKLREQLPPWIALVGIAGRDLLPELRVETQEQDIKEIAQQFALKMVPGLAGITGEQALAAVTGSSDETGWKARAKGAYQEIFFVTTQDKAPGFVETMKALAAEAGYPANEIGVYVQPQHMGTSCHLEFILPYDSNNPKETAKVKRLFQKASETMVGMGGFFARPYGTWAYLQLNRDAQSYKTIQELKRIFDPEGIMNPGKLTI
ncbi:FAD-binding oxidoreductase [Anoxynatronum sibiricum]|uniref:D-lactate dehydrogenase (cytochrome) n=1 Tax=Anoxynatronum sibiricum TaxID=210623 RepID=A0ABU9VZH3_9CLOT